MPSTPTGAHLAKTAGQLPRIGSILAQSPARHSLRKGALMKPQLLADFLFTGVVIVPATLVWADQIGLALFAFTALLIVACLCGWQEQVDAADPVSEDSDASHQQPPRPPAGAVHRSRSTPDRDPPRMRQ